MLDHVVIGVADYERSKAFYRAALAPLGLDVVLEADGVACGFGKQGNPEFWVGTRERSGPVHLAFTSPDRETTTSGLSVTSRRDRAGVRARRSTTVTALRAAGGRPPRAAASRRRSPEPAGSRGASVR